MKKALVLFLAIFTLSTMLPASKPGKGIITTSVVTTLDTQTSQTLQSLETVDPGQEAALLLAATHQAQRLQESVISLQDTDMSTWNADDKTDLAAFLVSLGPTLDGFYDEAGTLGYSDLQALFQDTRVILGTVVQTLEASDPEFAAIYDAMNQ